MPPKKALRKKGRKVKGKDTSNVVQKEEEQTEHPEDIFPLVLTSVTQELFDCVADEDVTEDSPYKLLLKDDILQDMKNRAAVSDFSPAKKIIQEYPEDELLLVFDRNFTYGQSFYLILTPEAKENLLNPPRPPSPEEPVIEIIKTPEPQPWVSLGSELEIEEESVKDTKGELSFKFSRVRRKFGGAVCFSDSSAPEGSQGCASCQDSRFSLKQTQRDCGTQAARQVQNNGTQTLWKCKTNICTQYEPEQLEEQERQRLIQSEDFSAFLDKATPWVMQALQLGNIINVFSDDWKDQCAADGEGGWSGQEAGGLKLSHTFIDKKNIMGKKISCLNWHPTIDGVFAISTTAPTKSPKPSILFYSLIDLSTPQLFLECPVFISVFKFCPSDPHIIVGGSVTGQLALWDISAYVAQLQGLPPAGRSEPVNTKAFVKENKAPVVQHSALSSSKLKQKAPITDVHWLPRTFQVTKEGLPMENKYNISVQIVTCSSKQSILFWDIRMASMRTQSLTDKKQKVDQMSHNSAPETFKHLDRTWTPLFKVSLPKIEAGEKSQPLKLSFEDSTCSSKKGKQTDEEGDEEPKDKPPYSELRIPSAKTLTPLNDVNTMLYIGTKDGDVVYTDWKTEKDDYDHPQSGKPLQSLNIHRSVVNTVQRSPFLKDVILTIGMRDFAIWKEGVMDGPIIQSSQSGVHYTVGCWSTSRPAVFFIGREDGGIEIWNLLVKTVEPTQILEHVINARISCIQPWSASSKQHLLAVCDDLGIIRVFEISRAFYAPMKNERLSVQKCFEFEQNRIQVPKMTSKLDTPHEPKKKPESKGSAGALKEDGVENQKVCDDYLNEDNSICQEIGL